MKLFECQACGQLLYFESVRCERCDRHLGYLPGKTTITALEPAGDSVWRALADEGRVYKRCGNYDAAHCHWLVRVESQRELCEACRLNRMIPNQAVEKYVAFWRRIEIAKRRLIYSLLRLQLPLANKNDDPNGLAFDFLAEQTEQHQIVTGHFNGVITINIAEADSAERERIKQEMKEPYRTLLGHLRHEIAHYYWQRIVSDSDWLDQVRSMFGDETRSYQQSLQNHYNAGPPDAWQTQYISAYASSHPWEDWAETWAHYLHVVDTLETAYAFGLQISPRVSDGVTTRASAQFDPYRETSFDRLIDTWLPVTFAVNSLNRSMGQPDLYPFVLPPRVVEKLGLVHQVIRSQRSATE